MKKTRRKKQLSATLCFGATDITKGGAFYSYADPENEQLFTEINTGRAPVSVLNVRPGQLVEVVVSKRTNEDYLPEQQRFWGPGSQLGSPVSV